MERSRNPAWPVPVEESALSAEGGARPVAEPPRTDRWGWLEALVWTLIYAGGLLMCLGFFVEAPQAALAADLQWIGAVAVGAGVALIAVRAALDD